MPRLLRRPAVLLHQHVKQGPGLEFGDVPQLASPVEEFPGIFSRKSKVSRNAAKKFYDVSYMIYRKRKRKRDRKHGGRDQKSSANTPDM